MFLAEIFNFIGCANDAACDITLHKIAYFLAYNNTTETTFVVPMINHFVSYLWAIVWLLWHKAFPMWCHPYYFHVQKCKISRQGTELQKLWKRSCIVISSDLCNLMKKILDKISFHRHFNISWHRLIIWSWTGKIWSVIFYFWWMGKSLLAMIL